MEIKVTTYKDHLEGAFKKLEKLCPEFTRVKRKGQILKSPTLEIAPLYEIIEGKAIEIEKPKKRMRNLSSKERSKIREWIKESYDSKVEAEKDSIDPHRARDDYYKATFCPLDQVDD